MTYAQSGLIQATDYNTLIGTSPGSTANALNTVWAVGSGSAGYGQTAVPTVAVSNTVTATQWASLINTLNSAIIHQSGSNSGISAPTAGTTINYLSTLQSSINTAYANRLLTSPTGAVVTSASFTSAWTSASTTSTLTRSFGLRATFASADQARYFFNARGLLSYSMFGIANDAVARTLAANNVSWSMAGIQNFIANVNGGRVGTGATLITNDTTKGYYNITTANATIVSVTSTTTNYTTDSGTITIKTNGLQGSNNDNGTTIDFWTTINSTSGGNAGGSFDDSLNLTIYQQITAVYPETTNLANTWGAVTITQL